MPTIVELVPYDANWMGDFAAADVLASDAWNASWLSTTSVALPYLASASDQGLSLSAFEPDP
jgi:hypothetical protein